MLVIVITQERETEGEGEGLFRVSVKEDGVRYKAFYTNRPEFEEVKADFIYCRGLFEEEDE